jgi:hypothetical protein
MVGRKICGIAAVLLATPRYLKEYGSPKTVADLAKHPLTQVRFLNGKLQPWVFREAPARPRLQYRPLTQRRGCWCQTHKPHCKRR